ncbi:hypothetical protein TNCV_4259801 [Trichonephila clavipes]|nr:hypothetical protein TNCV_4259801 [Trichonephila clavipes]
MQIAAKEAKDVSGHSDITVSIDAIEIFQRSESLHGLRYTKFLGDGDARAYKAVNEMQPYGNIGIEKLECVGRLCREMDWDSTTSFKTKNKRLTTRNDTDSIKVSDYPKIGDLVKN